MKKLILFALMLGWAAMPALRAAEKLPDVPPIKFIAVDGRQVDISKMHGKVVLVDFWATWCPGCVEEIPNVVAAYNKYHDKGLEVVGISLDHSKPELLSYIKEHNIPWPQYFDGKGWENDISSSLGISEIPAMFLIGRDGKFIHPSGDLDQAISAAIKSS